MSKSVVEICCYSVQSAIIAEESGADRIELCAGIYEGGTTPSFATIKMVKERVSIPVHVIIRPRGADFCYSDIEFDCMKRDIIKCKELGVDGIVSGILLPNGTIDVERAKELVALSKPMSFTFHRAFDMVKEPVQAMNQLMQLGVDRILTSGGKQTAEEGMGLIRQLVELAKGKIILMPGSGINDSNIQWIKEFTEATEFHCSAKSLIRGKMSYKNPAVNMGGVGNIPEFDYYEADPGKIRGIRSKLDSNTIFK